MHAPRRRTADAPASSRRGRRAGRVSGLCGQHGAQVPLSLGIIGLEPHGLLQVVERLVQAPFPTQGSPEVAVGLGVVGIQLQGLLKLADGFVQSPS